MTLMSAVSWAYSSPFGQDRESKTCLNIISNYFRSWQGNLSLIDKSPPDDEEGENWG